MDITLDALTRFEVILRHIVFDTVHIGTVNHARALSGDAFCDTDFVRVIAGAAPDCDYHELRELAKDELILYLQGGNHEDPD